MLLELSVVCESETGSSASIMKLSSWNIVLTAQLPSYKRVIYVHHAHGSEELYQWCVGHPEQWACEELYGASRACASRSSTSQNDGDGAQIHLLSDGMIFFSRSAEDNNTKFSKLLVMVMKFKKEGVESVDSFIISPFSTLIMITRKRKK